MAAITVTAANIRPCDGYTLNTRRYNCGGAVTPGQAVYVAADGDVEAADGDDVNQAQARGIALSDGSGSVAFAAGDRIDIVTHGPVSGYAGMTPGLPVYASVTAGRLDQVASAVPGDFNYIVGFAESDTVIFVNPQMDIPVAVPA